MAVIPQKPEEIFQTVVDEFKGIFGNDLLNLILYGSGASGHYIPGKSDINFLVILSEAGMEHLGDAALAVVRWRKKKVAIPLFMTQEDIISSLDSYPVEFFNMKAHHVLVYGADDMLQKLSFDPHSLRLQCERELKGKIFHLRTGFLSAEGKAKQLRELIKVSLPAFISLFKVLLFIKAKDIPRERKDMIQAVSVAYSIDAAVFLTCNEIKEGVDRVSSSDILIVFESYLKEITKLSRFVDRLEI